MAVLSNLEPKRVFEIFESLASIPHGSRNTKAISDFLNIADGNVSLTSFN